MLTVHALIVTLCYTVQATERRTRERMLQEQQKAEEAAHVAALSSSALLTEARDQTYSALSGTGSRYRVDHFKGFSQQEADAVRAEQARQREELEVRCAADLVKWVSW